MKRTAPRDQCVIKTNGEARHAFSSRPVLSYRATSALMTTVKGPGCAADGFIGRATGKYELMESHLGFIAVVNNLHKGRDTGKAWAGIIDISAALMTLVSLTGLVLIFFLHKKLRAGLYALVIGTVLCYVVYLVWVP
jgi:hypothetical protein